MLRELKVNIVNWPLTAPFRISRGVKTVADVIQVEIRQQGQCGRGEAVPYARYDESMDSVIRQIQLVRSAIEAGLPRLSLAELLPPGAARNALDCALWDLQAGLSGQPVYARLGETCLPQLTSAVTISLDSPKRMADAAKAVANVPLIKIKLDKEDPAARLRAVRSVASQSRLIVDPNESWDFDLLKKMQPVLQEARVDLVEQPLPAAEDESLIGFSGCCPICADESCHTRDDLGNLIGRYQAVNIKLDKTGGLTGALDLLHAARDSGFGVMVGCMVASSLGIAPALHVARHADFVDLDGPWWIKDDYPDGIRLSEGILAPPFPGFWGDGSVATRNR